MNLNNTQQADTNCKNTKMLSLLKEKQSGAKNIEFSSRRSERVCIDTGAARRICKLSQTLSYYDATRIPFTQQHSIASFRLADYVFQRKGKLEIRILSLMILNIGLVLA